MNNHSYYNLKNQHLVEDNLPPPLPEINGSEICVTNDGYSYVDEIHTTTTKSSARSRQQQASAQKSSNSGSSSGLYHYYQNHRARRTQPRITHNEKRYHSGQDATPQRKTHHECRWMETLVGCLINTLCIFSYFVYLVEIISITFLARHFITSSGGVF